MGTHCWRINSLKTNWLGYSPRFRWPWLQLIWGLSWALGRHGDRQNTGSLGIQSGQPPGHGRAVWRIEELETSNMVRAPTDPTAPQKNGASSWNILKLWRTQTSTLLKFSGKAHWLKTGASLVSQPTPFAHSRPFDPRRCLPDGPIIAPLLKLPAGTASPTICYQQGTVWSFTNAPVKNE